MRTAPGQMQMRKPPGVIIGAIRSSSEDSISSPVIAAVYDDTQQAKAAAKVLLTAQNGAKPFKSGSPVIYVGDTNIKVKVRPSKGRLLVRIYAYAKPEHLTSVFYAAGHVDVEVYKGFHDLLETKGAYSLTVAVGEEPLLQEVELLKYILDEKEVKI